MRSAGIWRALVVLALAASRRAAADLDDVPLDDVPLDDVPLDDVPLDDEPLDDVPLDDVPLDDQGALAASRRAAADRAPRDLPLYDVSLDEQDVLKGFSDLLELPLNITEDLLRTDWKHKHNFSIFIYTVYPAYSGIYNSTVFNHTPPFVGRNMRFVPKPRVTSFLYNAVPYVMDAIAPQQKPEFVRHEAFEVSQYNIKLNIVGFCSLLAVLSGPVTFVVLLLTTAVMMIAACCLLWGYYVTEQQLVTGLKDMTVAICNLTRSLNREFNRILRVPFTRSVPWNPLPSDGPTPTDYHSFCKLSKVKRSLMQSLAHCDLPACRDLQRQRILQLDTHIPHLQTPDVSEVLGAVTELRAQGLRERLADGRRKIDYADVKLDEYTDHYVKHYNESIVIMWKLGHVFIRRAWYWYTKFRVTLEDFETYRTTFLDDYVPIIHYILIVWLPLLVFPLLLLLGLPHCICGVRPRADCRFTVCSVISRGAGSRCIYCAMVVSILSFVVLTLVTAILFAAATLLQRGICESFDNATDSSFFSLVDSYVDIEQIMFRENANHSSKFKVSYVIHQVLYPTADPPYPYRRHYYWVFQLDRIAGEQKHHYFLTKRLLRSLNDMRSPPESAVPTPVTILSDGAKRGLQKLADIPFSDLPIDRIPTELKSGMKQFSKTSRELALLSDALERAAHSAAEQGGYRADALAAELRAAAARLLDLRLDIILPMFEHARAFNSTALKLQESLGFYVMNASLKEVIEDHLNEVAEAERFINGNFDKQARQVLRQAPKDLTQMLLPVYRHHIARICPHFNFLQPFANLIRRTLCENVLLPLHGMWMYLALAWLLLLLIMLMSRTLARLCLHTDPYPGPAVMCAYDVVKRHARETRKRRLRGAGELCETPCSPTCKRHRPYNDHSLSSESTKEP